MADQTVFAWQHGRLGTGIFCPKMRRTEAAAKRDAEEHYVARDRAKHPDSPPQRLEWRELTSPRGFGFGTRFWALYAERRVKRLGYASEMYGTDYVVSEMTIDGDVTAPAPADDHDRLAALVTALNDLRRAGIRLYQLPEGTTSWDACRGADVVGTVKPTHRDGPWEVLYDE